MSHGAEKTVSIQAKVRIFRACVLPDLLYASEVWSTTIVQEQRLNTFYFKCLRTLIGVNLGNRMPNEQLLQLTGQPHINDLLITNCLRWFGHVNRMHTDDNKLSMAKKVVFSYFPRANKPRNMGTQKRWQDKITEDLEKFNIRNWRRETLDKDKWRETINRFSHSNNPSSNISEAVQQYKQKADKRRVASNVPPPPKVTEVLTKQGLKTMMVHTHVETRNVQEAFSKLKVLPDTSKHVLQNGTRNTKFQQISKMNVVI
ncbi:unnamed protein product [Rotaria magnacalcarata]|uniref:Uncharacterized protein n=1 Tax=Rotaria magnacalcarata TaxID=392030 RepID=A0A816TRS2_9BILA|nr:unnamed protein product [Rotaria magnacalcarata]CAF4234104.1 unnamed protein product [Rotaria magnacalcarata]